MEISEAIEKAKVPGFAVCPICDDRLFSPMDKLSIYIYNKCLLHLEADSYQGKNIFKIAEHF